MAKDQVRKNISQSDAIAFANDEANRSLYKYQEIQDILKVHRVDVSSIDIYEGLSSTTSRKTQVINLAKPADPWNTKVVPATK